MDANQEPPYIRGMKRSISSKLFTACLFGVLSAPAATFAQDATPTTPETVLTVVEAPLSRESLNEVRLMLAEQDIRFNYGNFQFHPQSGDLIGAELFMVIEGQEYREYVEFVTPTCKLQVVRETGFRMEGC